MIYNFGLPFDIFPLLNKDWYIYTDKANTEEIITKMQSGATKKEIHYCGRPYNCFCVPFSVVLYLYINRNIYKYVAIYRDNRRNTYSVWTEKSKLGGGTRLNKILNRCNVKGFNQT